MQRKIIASSLLIFLVLPCFASHFAFENYSVKNGLPGDMVNAIYQDRRGYLWVGTAEGLGLFNGYSFLPFKNDQADLASISGNNIQCITEDHEQLVWVGTTTGLNFYNYETSSFLRPDGKSDAAKKLGYDDIRSIAVDSSNAIWVATNGDGLYRLKRVNDPKADSFDILHFAEGGSNHDITSNNVYSICIDHDDRGWIGTLDGICFFQCNSNPQFVRMHIRNAGAAGKNYISRLCLDQENSVWALSPNLLDRLILPHGTMDTSSLKIEPFCPAIKRLTSAKSLSMMDFREDEQGYCWVSIFETGVIRFKTPSANEDISAIETVDSLHHVYSIYQHDDDIIWFGSESGLSKFVCDQQFFMPELASFSNKFSPEQAVYEDRGGNIWLGGEGNLLLKSASDETYVPLPDLGFNPVNCIIESTAGDLLAGSNKGLIIIQDGDVQKLIQTKSSGIHTELKTDKNSSLPGINIFCFAEDSDHNIWIGSDGAIACYHPVSRDLTIAIKSNAKSFPPEYYFHCMALEGTDSLWVGSDKGLYLFKINSVRDTLITVMANEEIHSLCLDRETGCLWIATSEGIQCYNTGRHLFQSGLSERNFMKVSITSMVEDNEGDLWFTTSDGLTEWNPQTGHVNYFENGLPLFANNVHDCNLIKKSGGTILAINANGIYSFNPATIPFKNNALPVVITDFTILGNSIFNSKSRTEGEIFRNTNAITLCPNQNQFTIYFASLNFVNPDKAEYQYKLVAAGDSSGWSIPQTSKMANYSLLGHGTYTFYVKELNSNEGMSCAITILPYFYETIWFRVSVILFCMLLSGLIFFIFYRVRLQRILVAQKIRNKIASDLHDDIGSSLNSINVYSEIVRRSLKDPDPKTVKAVESMGNTSRLMIDTMSDIVWAIDQKNDDFEHILQRMKYFAGELLAEKHIGLHFDFDEPVKKIKLPMEKRKSFYLIYKEAINNAYKYSEAKQVSVALTLQNNHLLMTIADDGKGFDDVKQSLGGNGLRNMQTRANEVKAKLNIKSCAGKGTQVYLDVEVK